MLNVYFKVIKGGTLRREYIASWLYNKFSDRYHDFGVADYSNGKGVKAHTFTYNRSKYYVKGEVLYIGFRGIKEVEEIFRDRLEIGEVVRFGEVVLEYIFVEEVGYIKRDYYLIKSPIILRYSNRIKDIMLKRGYEYIEGNQEFTPEDCKELWEEEIKNLIVSKAELIYGTELQGLKDISILDYKISMCSVVIRDKKLIYKGTLGRLSIEGDYFWDEFIQRIGLGHRNSYGFGVIG